MPCKKSGYDRAAPHCARHPPQHKKNQDGIQGMEGDICHVMWSSPEPKNLDVSHVRKPCYRMPIRSFAVQPAKRPSDARLAETLQNERILVHINRIIVVHELVLSNRPVEDERDS